MNLALLVFEARRTIRNRRSLMFSAVLPVIFFLVFSNGADTETLGGLTVLPYIMVSMATYGAMNALFTGGGVIASERAAGWPRQLRISGVHGRDYLFTKAVVPYATAIPGLVAVFGLGALRHVELSPGRWLAAGGAILLSLLPVAVLGIAIGYAARPQSLAALFGIGSAMLSLLGGLWAPLETMPHLMQTIMRLLPTYWAGRAGRGVLTGSWVGWQGVAVIAFWTVAFGALAVYAYRNDALRPTVAGAT